MRRLILVGGPTGSGKSALALALAEQFGGAVVNADAMQIYDGLAILSNQPSAAEKARVPHVLFGTLAPSETCSAGRWRKLAIDACETIWKSGRIPIVAGGTGLYIRALTQGLSPIPDVPADVREAARGLLAQLGPTALHRRLIARDPAMGARLRPSDSQRVVRAWEVLEATGRSLAEWQEAAPEGGIDARIFGIAAMPPRAALYAACDARFAAMVQRGAIDEVRALIALGLDPSLPAMKMLGVPELAAHLAGELPLDAAIVRAQTATRHYAKRQYTWFRHQWTPDITLDAQFSESHSNEIFSKIRESLLTVA